MCAWTPQAIDVLTYGTVMRIFLLPSVIRSFEFPAIISASSLYSTYTGLSVLRAVLLRMCEDENVLHSARSM